MRIIHRKSRGQRLLEKLASEVSRRPAVKGGAAAATGVAAALTAVSAAVSSYRRKTNG
jgi:hypothetical protein